MSRTVPRLAPKNVPNSSLMAGLSSPVFGLMPLKAPSSRLQCTIRGMKVAASDSPMVVLM